MASKRKKKKQHVKRWDKDSATHARREKALNYIEAGGLRTSAEMAHHNKGTTPTDWAKVLSQLEDARLIYDTGERMARCRVFAYGRRPPKVAETRAQNAAPVRLEVPTAAPAVVPMPAAGIDAIVALLRTMQKELDELRAFRTYIVGASQHAAQPHKE